MKTVEGMNVICEGTGKVCYTEREAGHVLNTCRSHVYVGNHHSVKNRYCNSKEIPRRKYFCKECGFYHLTHLPLYDFDSYKGRWEDSFYREYNRRKSV